MLLESILNFWSVYWTKFFRGSIIISSLCILLSSLVIALFNQLIFVESLLENQEINNDSLPIHQCPVQFRNLCYCGFAVYRSPYISEYFGKERLTFVTNCTDTRFDDASLLSFVPTETEVLIFSGNNFTELPANLLNHDQQYDNLLLVDLSRNNIQNVHGKAFHNMRLVRTFILNDNNITVNVDNIHPRLFNSLKNLEELHLRNAFSNHSSSYTDNFDYIQGHKLMYVLYEIFTQSQLNNLKVLNLESNHIASVPNEKFFCSFPQLRRLLLSKNDLSRFNLDLSCLNDLSLIDVSENRISTIDNQSINYLISSPSISYRVNISENPFRCDCLLKDFFRFIHNRTIYYHHHQNPYKLTFDWYEEFKCHGNWPPTIVGKYLDDIKESDLICQDQNEEISMINLVGIESSINNQQKKESIKRYRYYITLSYLILAFLLSLLAFLVGVLIYTNREFLQSSWDIFWTELNSKSDYSALDKTETQSATSENKNNWWRKIRQKSKVHNQRHYYHTDGIHKNRLTFRNLNVAEEQL